MSVGRRVSVLVGVNNSAPREVGVGVKVIGVGVAVAKRFCVGIGVSLMKGVAVSMGGGEVCVASSAGKPGSPEQPASRIAIKRTWMSFFMMNLYVLVCRSRVENGAMRQRDIRP